MEDNIIVRKVHTHEDRCECTRRKFGNSACGYRAYLVTDNGRVRDIQGTLHETPEGAREALQAFIKECESGN